MENRTRRRSRTNSTFGHEDTALNLIKHVRRRGIYYVDGLEIEVEVLDTKYSWGQTRYLIIPVAGSGSKWVSAHLHLEEQHGEEKTVQSPS